MLELGDIRSIVDLRYRFRVFLAVSIITSEIIFKVGHQYLTLIVLGRGEMVFAPTSSLYYN